ncbi:MAG: hypothetical protein ACRC76_03720 [Proteocatella sp.]
MAIKVIGLTKDFRTNTQVVYAQASINDYLILVGTNFDEFEIQRKRQKHKAYHRMSDDIKNGGLLPTITLAVKPDFVDELLGFIAKNDTLELGNRLAYPERVNILDGLQRTFIIKDLKDAGVNFPPEQEVLLEFWLEKEVKHLIYRLIVLNAGQKPMSMRHQVELLFTTLREKLEGTIPNLKIYAEREGTRRSRAGKYPLDRMATAYQSFLSKSPEIERENIIARQLVEDSVFDFDEDKLGRQFEEFTLYLKLLTDIDNEAYKIYTELYHSCNDNVEWPNWIAQENVINSFFAAIGDFGSNNNRVERIHKALGSLLRGMQENREDDPFGLKALHLILPGINSKKQNVGHATRKLLTAGFKEFFREEGEKSLAECWKTEA